eukprot:4372731-Prymnesium_polylepis.2
MRLLVERVRKSSAHRAPSCVWWRAHEAAARKHGARGETSAQGVRMLLHTAAHVVRCRRLRDAGA